MKAVLALVLITIAMAQAGDSLSVEEEWNNYKTKFNKNYGDEEDQTRLKLYLNNKKKIEEHNAKYQKGEVSYSLGTNQFSDLTEDEMKHRFGAKPKPNSG